MTINTAIDFIGWTGSAAVVSAYALISSGRLNVKSRIYQLLNLVGGIFLVINTLFYGAYPSTFVNIVWSLIALSGFVRMGKEFIENGKRESTIQPQKNN